MEVGDTVFFLVEGVLVRDTISKITQKYVFLEVSQRRKAKTGIFYDQEDYIRYCINYLRWLLDRQIVRDFGELRLIVDGKTSNVRFETWLLNNTWLFGDRHGVAKILDELDNYPEELI